MTPQTAPAESATGSATPAPGPRPVRALTGAGLAVLLLAYLPVNMTFGSVNLLEPAIVTDRKSVV